MGGGSPSRRNQPRSQAGAQHIHLLLRFVMHGMPDATAGMGGGFAKRLASVASVGRGATLNFVAPKETAAPGPEPVAAVPQSFLAQCPLQIGLAGGNAGITVEVLAGWRERAAPNVCKEEQRCLYIITVVIKSASVQASSEGGHTWRERRIEWVGGYLPPTHVAAAAALAGPPRRRR
jgi:hypothetical protein